jgi:hypothetical protein
VSDAARHADALHVFARTAARRIGRQGRDEATVVVETSDDDPGAGCAVAIVDDRVGLDAAGAARRGRDLRAREGVDAGLQGGAAGASPARPRR